jgi:hypothetical protein
MTKDGIEDDVHQQDGKGKAVDTGDIHYLNEGEVEILGMAQARPWETGEEERPNVFQGDPEKRGHDDRLETESLMEEPTEKSECPEKEAQIKDEEQQDKNADDERDVSVGMDRHDNPVKNSQKGDESGQIPEAEAMK